MGYNVMENVQRLCYQVAHEKDERRKSCAKAVELVTFELDGAERVCFREMASYSSGRAEALGEVAQLLERIMNEKEVPDAH